MGLVRRRLGRQYFLRFSRSKKEKKTSEMVNKCREEDQERKCGFILARTKSCYCLSGLGPRSHDLVPQGLLFQFIFSFLQLKPLRRSLKKRMTRLTLLFRKQNSWGLHQLLPYPSSSRFQP